MNLKNIIYFTSLALPVFLNLSEPASSQYQPQRTVILYEHDQWKGSCCVVNVGQNIKNLHKAPYKFGDEASSLQFNIPAGYCAVLFEDDSYKKPRLILESGCGRIGDLKRHVNPNTGKKYDLGDKISSIGFYTVSQINSDGAFKSVPRARSQR